MEKLSNDTLLIANDVFIVLLNKITKRFKEKHNINSLYRDFQLYGFGNYDINKPTIKKDLEDIIHGYVNGKYLYNKYREALTGKPIIKISREYKLAFFKYVGYRDLNEFIDSHDFSSSQKKQQLSLLNQKGKDEEYYYVCYYLGENEQMNKGQAIIYNDWKTLEMKYFYEEEEGKQGVYTFFGNIVNSENFVHFNTKFFSGSKKIEGAKFVFFIGKSALNERYYLIGTYAGSDKYDRAVAGKMILKKYDTKFEMEQEAHNSEFNSLISQELVRKRIVVESNLKRNPLTFSKKSPYAQVLPKITGNYNFIFYVNDLSYSLKICIQKYHYNIISLDNSMIIEEDEIKIINKGQIINLDFSISGMFHLQKLSIYFKSINFINGGEGNFSGIDVNNNIVTGNIIVSEI